MKTPRPFGYAEGNANIPLRSVVAAHIVTDDEGNFVSASWTAEGELDRRVGVADNPSDLIAGFLTYQYRGYELLLFQADHDMRYLLPPLERLIADGYEVTFTMDGRQRIIYAKIARGKHRWYIRDASAMLPLTLPELRQLSGCSDAQRPEVVLLRAYKRFAGTLRDTFGVRPSVTIGSTAINACQTTIPEGTAYYRQRPEVEGLAREGYFGGLVWLNSLAAVGECTYIDCNAMYAAAMRQGVPIMSPTYTRTYYEGFPGIYSCRCYCEGTIPFAFVPARNPVSWGVSYPKGEWFETVLTSPTIELARDRGYTVEVLEGYVFEELAYPFDPFINKCEQLEIEYKEVGAGHVIKALRNSITGKFGQRPVGKEYYLTAEPTEDMTPVIAFDDGEIIDNLYYLEVDIERPYMMPVWAAWITANARNTLTRLVYALGPEYCHYGDTDAVILDNHRLFFADRSGLFSIGKAYGEWKIKERFQSFRAMGKKLYAGQSVDGEWVIVSAGIKRGVLTKEDMAALVPHAPPLMTREYRQDRRAIHTAGGRPISEMVSKELSIERETVPQITLDWGDFDAKNTIRTP